MTELTQLTHGNVFYGETAFPKTKTREIAMSDTTNFNVQSNANQNGHVNAQVQETRAPNLKITNTQNSADIVSQNKVLESGTYDASKLSGGENNFGAAPAADRVQSHATTASHPTQQGQSIQGASPTANVSNVANTQNPATTSPATVNQSVSLDKKVNEWADPQWQCIIEFIGQGFSGERLMKIIGLKRRKDLESIFYRLSVHVKQTYVIKWESNASQFKHALPDLKAGKDGSLRISDVRFKRHGLKVSAGIYFTMDKVSDTEIKLIILPK